MTTAAAEEGLALNLALVRNPEQVVEQARRCAVVLKAVIDSKPKKVEIREGETYLEFSDWQLLGRFYGFTAKVVDSQPVEGRGDEFVGYTARAVAVDRDGNEASAAESMCSNAEARWEDRDEFQIKSMAQTRACAKAMRNILGWVAVLAGYSDTPAEEMTGGERAAAPKASKVREDGVTTVKDITVFRRAKPDAPRQWVLYNVKFEDGRSGKCFGDNATFKKAKELEVSKAPCKPKIEPAEKGGNDLTGFDDLPQQQGAAPAADSAANEPPPPADSEQPVVETILTTRPAAGELGAQGWHVVQGSERVYVTKDTTVLDTIKTLQRDKDKVVFKFEVAELGGRRVRRVVTLADPAEASTPQQAVPEAAK